MMVVETDPPRRLRTEVVDNRQYGGTWTWDLEPTNEGGCHLTITEDGAIYNVVFRFVARFFMGLSGDDRQVPPGPRQQIRRIDE